MLRNIFSLVGRQPLKSLPFKQLIGKEKMKNIKNRTIASLIATRLKLKERT
jgi:hypothetical protein